MNWSRIVLIIAIASLAACGGSSSTAPTPTQASITVTLSPNPVTATACSPTCQGANGSFRFRADGTLTIQETAGIGGNVNSITAMHPNATIVFSVADIVQRSGTNHVAARGTLIVPLSTFTAPLDNPNATRQAVVPYVVQFTDDRGNQLTGTVQWTVN